MSRNNIAFLAFVILLILYAPFAYSSELHGGILSAKQFWILGFFCLFFFTLATIILTKPRHEISFVFNIIDIFVLALFIYLSLRVIFQQQPVISNLRYVNFALYTVLFFILKNIIFSNRNYQDGRKGHGLVIKVIFLYVIILTGLLQSVIGFLQLFDLKSSFHSYFKITGTFVNPAPYAIYLSIIFPLAVGTHLYFRNKVLALARRAKKKNRHVFISLFYNLVANIPLITIVIIAMVLPATMIRTSWVAVVMGTSVILISYFYRGNIFRRILISFKESKRMFRFVTGVLGVLIILILSIELFTLKLNSSKGKLFIWQVTGTMIEKHPYFGIGFGRFEAEYNNYQSQWFSLNPVERNSTTAAVAGNTKYAFNDLLELLAETGSIGLILFVGLITSAFIILYGRYKLKRQIKDIKDGHKSEIGLIPTLLGCFTTILICMLFSFPYTVLPIVVLFFLILAMVSSLSKISLLQKDFIFKRTQTVLVSIMLYFLSLSIGVYNYRQIRSYFIWDEADMLYKIGNYSAACASYEEVYQELKYNGEFLQFYGKSLLLEKDYHKSLRVLNQACNLSSDVYLFMTRGDCFKALNEFDKAEENYLFAMNMMPLMLYPKYKLVVLYQEMGDKEKFKSVGQEILKSKVKVNSLAITEMKEKVRQMLKINNNLNAK